MKLKYNFVTNKIGEKYVAVALGDSLENFRKFIKMNETGKYIFDMLKKDVTREEIINSMLKDFEDATQIEVSETVDEFIFKLKEAAVIE